MPMSVMENASNNKLAREQDRGSKNIRKRINPR
jgi:hypothetical protein